MCGICGVFDYSRAESGIDEPLLRRMTDVIAHRGPDDEGAYISPDKKLGLGFRRLSIIDLSPAGHQPMSNADGSVWIVFNGEIYNHLELRAELERKGYRYHSKTDTETILYGYQEWGAGVFRRMNGMWSIAIWDTRKKQLVCARDRIGVKPFYYTFAGGRFIFGSEIKAILRHPAISAELDEDALDAYFSFLMPPAPGTMFKGIEKLEPGTMLTIGAGGEVAKEKYWDVLDACAGAQLPDSTSEEEIEAEIIRLLRRSIKDRMMSDVPFGVFLSGGIDSSLNVALMAELMDRPVQTFTVGFKELEKYNELEYAHAVVKRFNTNHHEVLIGHDDAIEIFDKLAWHTDEPNGDPVCIPLWFLAKIARESGTIVLQVGEGSDEEFAGYGYMMRDVRFDKRIWRHYLQLPRFVRRGVCALASAYLMPARRYVELDYLRRAAAGEELAWTGPVKLPDAQKRLLMPARFRSARGLPENKFSSSALAARWDGELRARAPGSDFLRRLIFLEFRHRLPELLLMRVDKVTMAHSIETRVPFLDHRLVEYAMRIPSSLKLKNGTPKYVLKKAVEGVIPREIIHRPKQGFNAPTTEWFRGPLEQYARSRIFSSRLKNEKLFDYEFVKKLFVDNKKGRNKGLSIWALLNFTIWWENWIGE